MSKGNPICRFRLRGELLRQFAAEVERNNANPLLESMNDSEAIRLAIAEWINHRRRSRKEKEIEFDPCIFTND